MDNHKPFTNENQYTAMIDGTYTIFKTVYVTKKTGKKIEVKNENRYWFQFWKPKTLLLDEMVTEKVKSESQTLKLKKGDTVDLNVTIPGDENEG